MTKSINPAAAAAMELQACLETAPDQNIVTCSAEDLIVHKSFASRDLDWLDVERILQRQGNTLNIAQIFEELKPLAELKEDLGIVPRLEALMRKRGISG